MQAVPCERGCGKTIATGVRISGTAMEVTDNSRPFNTVIQIANST